MPFRPLLCTKGGVFALTRAQTRFPRLAARDPAPFAGVGVDGDQMGEIVPEAARAVAAQHSAVVAAAGPWLSRPRTPFWLLSIVGSQTMRFALSEGGRLRAAQRAQPLKRPYRNGFHEPLSDLVILPRALTLGVLSSDVGRLLFLLAERMSSAFQASAVTPQN